jgi:hypothetical protein
LAEVPSAWSAVDWTYQKFCAAGLLLGSAWHAALQWMVIAPVPAGAFSVAPRPGV